MTVKKAEKITGCSLMVVEADGLVVVEALAEDSGGKGVVASVSDKSLKGALHKVVAAVYEKNRMEAFAKANWSCSGCGRSGVGLQAHHMVHRSMGRRDDSVSNILPLCFSCHEKAHQVQSASGNSSNRQRALRESAFVSRDSTEEATSPEAQGAD